MEMKKALVYVIICLVIAITTSFAEGISAGNNVDDKVSNGANSNIQIQQENFQRRISSKQFWEETAAVNPSYGEINSAINDMSNKYKIPAIIIKAFVYQESSWRQFDSDGNPLISPDGGIGLTQVTVPDTDANSENMTLGTIIPGAQGDNPFSIEISTVEVDINRLKNDWVYNLEIGCQILLAKKAECLGQGDDATILENWYYPLAYYNGFAVNGANDPANPTYSRNVSENWHWRSTSYFPYQECVFNIIAQLYTLSNDVKSFFEPSYKITLPGPKAVETGAGNYEYVDENFAGGKFITYYRDNRAVVDGQTFNNIVIHQVEFGGATTTPAVPFYSQRDNRWKDDLMTGGCKVGDYGCAMTCIAMLLKYYGSDTNPDKLNTWLCNNAGYNENCEIYWITAADYDGTNGMTYINGNDIWNNWSELDNQLSQGYPVIVKVDSNLQTAPIEGHWVLVTHRSGSSGNPSSYYINDPWDLNYTEKTLASYYDPVYDNTFFAMRIYHGEVDFTPPYKLPYPATVQYKCQQGNNTGPSHKGKAQYAWDFGGSTGGASIGDPIVTARSGKVHMVEEGFPDDGHENKNPNTANYVVIDHEDGTYALYLHLQQNSVPVSVGDFVHQGQHIGNIGLSGQTTGPHLHFQVQNSGVSWWEQSIPISFSDPDVAKDNGIPQTGEWYTSSNTPVPSTKFSPGDYVQTTENLHMRTEPKINDNIITTIPSGSTVQVVEDENNGIFADGHYWWHVQFGDDNGWCAEDWLEKVEPLELLTIDQFLTQFKNSIAGKGTGFFRRLTNPSVENHFQDLLSALLTNDLTNAQSEIEALNDLDVRYKLVQITDAVGGDVYGFMERVSPGHPDYRGWGAVLVRPYAAGYTIYQAPHVKADVYTEDITLDAFVDDENSLLVMFSGAHRNANGDGDDDGEPDSDVAHDTENLFHALTAFLANKGLTDSKPYWFIQMHGATDRTSEPTIVGSDGADIPTPTPISPLVQIDDAVDDAGYVTMGVCGWPEGSSDDEDGDYLLCATTNVQGDFLESLGLRQTFMHFEIERTARDDYNAGSGPGYDGIRSLLTAIATVLDASPAVVAADITVTPDSWDYGEVYVGSFADKTFVVENKGNAKLQVSEVKLEGDEDFTIKSGGAPFELNPGETHEIVVRFEPKSEIITTASIGLMAVPPRTATLSIFSNDPDESQLDISLSGIGVEVASKFMLPVQDDNPNDNLTWNVPFNYFGNYYGDMGGYHSGEDWNLIGGAPDADLGEPVYAIGNGTVEKVSDLGSLGYLVALKHNGVFTIPKKSATENGQSYSYPTEVVSSIYSVYMHINNIAVAEGDYVGQGVILGNIMDPGGGPHLHFEIRHPDATHSNNWSMVGSPSNWAEDNGSYTGYYLNLQEMVDAGVRTPKEFISVNGVIEPTFSNADIALIIDSSGSMDWNDPNDLRKDAAKFFIDLAEPGTQIAIVDFDSSARTYASLTPVDDPANKQALKNAVDRVDSDGGTDLGDGLQQGYNELVASAFPDAKKAGVMLTDGQGDYNGQASLYADKGWSVYTVGLSDDVDENLLRQIAESTPEGEYFPASLDNMQTIYNMVFAKVTDASVISSYKGFINQSQEILKTVLIDLVEQVKFAANWQGSKIDLVLIAPDGTEIKPTDAASYPNIEYKESNTFAIYTVKNPMPGEWGMKAVGTNIPPGGEQYNLTATATSDFITTLLPFEPSYSVGDTIRVGIRIKEKIGDTSEPVLGATASAEVVRPDGQIDSLELFDDGVHNDMNASDGVYANNYANVDKEGMYLFRVNATNGFTREIQEQVVVGAIDNVYVDGGTLTPAAGATLEQSPDVISAVISGPAGNINEDSIELELDNQTVQHSYDTINQIVSYQPPTPLSGGQHTVGLSFKDTGGTLTTAAWSFEIEGVVDVVANFTYSPTEPVESQTVNFTDTSTPTGEIVEWQWDFENDGTIDSTNQNPTHTYSDDGTYTVALKVKHSSGTWSDITTKTITVKSVATLISSIDVSASDTSLKADGSSTSTITIKTLDDSGNPIAVDDIADITLEITSGSGSIGEVSGADGTYTATYTAGTTAGTVTIKATYDTLEDTVEIKLSEPIPANEPPSITAIDDQEVFVGSTITIEVEASDPDGDTLSYSATNLPNGATFDSSTHKFSWTPTSDQIGTHTVSFAVMDQEDGDTESVEITVKPVEIIIEPETGSVTDTIKITGADFVPEETLNIDFGGIEMTVNTDAEGKFTKEFILKQVLAEGDVTVTVTGSSGAFASTTFTYSDTKSPAISSITIDPEGPYKAGDTITVSVEQRDDFDIADSGSFTIGESISGVLSNDGTTTWKGSYTVKDGDDIVAKVAAELQDAKGNTSYMETQDTVTIDTVIQIDSVTVEGSPAALSGDLTVTVEGESGAQATCEIEGITDVSIEMTESTDTPGVYTATYTAKEGDNVEDAKLTVVLTDAAGNSITDDSQLVTIDTTPPILTNTSADSVIVYRTFVISVLSEANAEVTADVSALNADIVAPLELEAGETVDGEANYTGEVEVFVEESGVKTVKVMAQDTVGNEAVLDVSVEVIATTKFTVWFNPGLNLFHLPVTGSQFKTISGLYNFLVSEGVQLQMLIYYDHTRKVFQLYGNDSKEDSVEDVELKPYTGMIAMVNYLSRPKAVTFEGLPYKETDLLIKEGINLVGVPVDTPEIATLSNLVDAIGEDNIDTLATLKEGRFVYLSEAGNPEVTGSDSFLITVKNDVTLKLEGEPWANEGITATPSIPITQRNLNSADIMVVHGITVLEETYEALDGLNVTVANLSNNLSQDDVSGQFTKDGKYSVVFVNTKSKSVARVGDLLRISIDDPSENFGAEPVEHKVTEEDIQNGVIALDLPLFKIPEHSALLQNYPNPFNPDTWIPFLLAEPANVEVRIYDVTGRIVRVLDFGQRRAGIYVDRDKAVYWDGRNRTGEKVSSGLYFYRLQAGNYSSTKRMLILK